MVIMCNLFSETSGRLALERSAEAEAPGRGAGRYQAFLSSFPEQLAPEVTLRAVTYRSPRTPTSARADLERASIVSGARPRPGRSRLARRIYGSLGMRPRPPPEAVTIDQFFTDLVLTR